MAARGDGRPKEHGHGNAEAAARRRGGARQRRATNGHSCASTTSSAWELLQTYLKGCRGLDNRLRGRKSCGPLVSHTRRWGGGERS